MKNRTTLVLMEQLLMILVFALAAALCLRAFALSDRLSRESEAQDRAVLLAQNAAEVCKAGGGDWDYMETVLGGNALGYSWTVLYNGRMEPVAAAEEAAYEVVVRPETAEAPGLGRATVSVFEMDGGDLLFQLPAAWQEEVRHGVFRIFGKYFSESAPFSGF